MTAIRSFAPVADRHARVLILGSMPGVESLRARQYYAHPRNAFWRIMGDLVGAVPLLPYTRRTRRLRLAGIAVWDVLASCRREGSLDAAIDPQSAVANDLPSFLARHHRIRHLFFNGATAEHCFRRHVQPLLVMDALVARRLPSTSPAHAALPYAGKLQAWRAVTKALTATANK